MPRAIRELRDLPDEELLARLEGLKEELFNLRFQFATGQLDNPMRIKMVRHDLARILTLLRQRQTEEELEAMVAQADEQALAESREAQARGEKKGQSLADAAYEPRQDEESEFGAETMAPAEEARE